MAGELILVVDDNPQNLRLARMILRYAGYDVVTAADAREAIASMAAAPPALVVMDVQLPDIDGLALTRQIKADPARRHIPVLALTAYAMKGDDVKVMAAGCDGYLAKPIDADTLAKAVAEQLARAGVR
jgi:CheY-like chemotaxis protein